MKQLLPSNKNYRNGTIDLQIRFITIFKDAPEKKIHFPAANFPNDYQWSCRVWNLIKIVVFSPVTFSKSDCKLFIDLKIPLSIPSFTN